MPIHEITQSTTEQMMPLPNKDIPGKLITHASWEETLRKEMTPYNGTMYRPPSKPPDRQNCLNDKISRRVLPYINPNRRPLPKPQNIQNSNGERIGILEKENWPYVEPDYRPLPKPPPNIFDVARMPKIK